MDEQTVSVFVPAPWSDRRVLLRPPEGQSWSRAEVAGQPLERDAAGHGWVAEPGLMFGAWNMVSAGGPIADARLEAAEGFQIRSLEASLASERSLSVRVRLTAPGPVDLHFSLSRSDGRQIGSMDVTVGRRSADLTIEMQLPGPISGPCRLKAALCIGDRVADNARIDLTL